MIFYIIFIFSFIFLINFEIYNINISTILLLPLIYNLKTKFDKKYNSINKFLIYSIIIFIIYANLYYFVNDSGIEIYAKNYSVVLYTIIGLIIINNSKYFIKNRRYFFYFFSLAYFVYWLGFIFLKNDFQSINFVFLKVTHRTTVAYFLVFFFSFIVFLSNSQLLKIFLIFTTTFHLLLNTSRGPLVIFLLFLYYFFKQKYIIINFRDKRIYFFIVLSILALHFLQWNVLNYFIQRLTSPFTKSGDSSGYRISVLLDGFKLIFNNPFGLQGNNAFNQKFALVSRLNLFYSDMLPTDNTFIYLGIHGGIFILFLYVINIIRLLLTKEMINRIFALTIFLVFIFDDVFNGIFITMISVLLSMVIYVKKR